MSPRWRAFAALLLLAPAPSVGVWFALQGLHGWQGGLIWVLCKVWMLLGPALWYYLVEGQAWRWPRWQTRGLLAGLTLGLMMAASIFAAWFGLAEGQINPAPMQEKLAPLGLTQPAVYLGLAAYWSLGNSLVEEYVFRWFFVRQCEQLASRWAIPLAAAIFTAHHTLALAFYVTPLWNLLASSGVFIAGLLWSWLYHSSRNVWACWLSHVLADIAVFTIGALLLFG